MVFNFYVIAQFATAILSSIIVIKLLLDYKKEKTFLTLFFIGFFLIMIAFALIHSYILLNDLEEAYFWLLTGRDIGSIFLLFITAYLLTISFYILEYKVLYSVPIMAAAILFLIRFFIPWELFDMIRMFALIGFTIPSIILFGYSVSKNQDGKSLGFMIFLILYSIAGPLFNGLPDIAGLLHFSAQIIVLLGMFGVWDKALKKEKVEEGEIYL